ncbi:YigZ family protein [soil metagenome]
MLNVTRTIAHDGQHEIEILKSRFICSVFRVVDDVEARGYLEQLRKRYWDANHNCYAYIIGEGGRLQKASDDGEPSGTAGVPMLEVLKRRELVDVLAVVTRYFGGTKLGAGGLIRAYGRSVTEGLNEVGIVERRPRAIVEIEVDHSTAGRLENSFRNSIYTLADTRYEDAVTFVTHLPDEDVPELNAWLGEQTNGSVQGVVADHGIVEIPVDD